MRAALCPECFEWLSEGQNLCSACGTKLQTTTAENERRLGIGDSTRPAALETALWKTVQGRDWGGAAAVARRIPQAVPGDVLVTLADRIRTEGPPDPRRYRLAIRLYRAAIESRPDAFDALLGLGIALYQVGESEQAVLRLFEAQRLNPTHALVSGYLARCEYDLGQYGDATVHAVEALLRDPADAAGAHDVLTAVANARALELGVAEKLVETLPGGTEGREHAKLVLAELCISQGDGDRALRLLAGLPQSERASVAGAQALQLAGKTDEALGGLAEARKQYPGSVPLLATIVRIQKEAKRFPEALRTLTEIETHDRGAGWKWRLERARVLVAMKNPEGAVRVLERVVEERTGEYEPAALLLRTLYYELSSPDYPRIRHWLEPIFKATAISPTHVQDSPDEYRPRADAVSDILAIAGFAWIDLPDGTARAREAFEAALALYPKWADAWFGLGLAARRDGRLEEAIRCFRAALDLHSKFRNARYQLVRSLLDVGRVEEGSKILADGLAERPDDSLYQQLLERIRKTKPESPVAPAREQQDATAPQLPRESPSQHPPTGSPRLAPILELPDFVRDLTIMAQEGQLEDITGREAELDELMEILCRYGKGNPVILGAAGTGKTALVAGLVHRVLRGAVPEQLIGQRVLEVLHAGLRHRGGLVGTLEEKVEELSKIWERGDVILFVDELHVLVGAGASRGHESGGLDQLLKPFLARPGLRLIGATTWAEYDRYVRPDPALERRFTPLSLAEPDREQTAKICCFLRNRWFDRYHVQLPDERIHEGIALSERYLPARNFPDKAIDLLERACVRASVRGEAKVTSATLLDVAKALGRRAELPDFVRDLTLMAEQSELQDVTGRDQELDELVETLCRHGKGNPVIIGEAGTGKTALVAGLAHRIVRGQVPLQLAEQRILEISHAGLMRDTGIVGQFETKVDKLRQIWEHDNVILFVDEIHLIVGAGSYRGHESGGLDQLLKPLLTRPGLHLIGATTRAEYERWIASDPALERRFTPLALRTPKRAETVQICRFLRGRWEQNYSVTVADELIDLAVDLSDLHLAARNFPDKAIDLLERAFVKASLRAGATPGAVTRDDIVAALASLAGIGLQEAEQVARGEGIENRLREKIVSQDDAIRLVSRVVEVARAGMDAKPHRPDGVFVLAGPPGTGKRKLCRTLAEVLGGSEARPVTLDLPAYGRIHEILEETIKRTPAAIFALAGFVEADPAVQSIFARIFAEGRLEVPGKVDLDFGRSIFAILDDHDVAHGDGAIGFQHETRHDELQRHLERRFSPSLLAAVDAVVEFHPLSVEAVEEVVRRKLRELAARYVDRGIRLEVGSEVPAALARAVAGRAEGLRAIRGLVEDTINRPLAAHVLRGARAVRAAAQGDAIVVEPFPG